MELSIIYQPSEIITTATTPSNVARLSNGRRGKKQKVVIKTLTHSGPIEFDSIILSHDIILLTIRTNSVGNRTSRDRKRYRTLDGVICISLGVYISVDSAIIQNHTEICCSCLFLQKHPPRRKQIRHRQLIKVKISQTILLVGHFVGKLIIFTNGKHRWIDDIVQAACRSDQGAISHVGRTSRIE